MKETRKHLLERQRKWVAINSVSFKTGKKYHSTAESYYQQIRKISDRLCREHGLSVVMETGSKGISYAEWKLHKAGSADPA